MCSIYENGQLMAYKDMCRTHQLEYFGNSLEGKVSNRSGGHGSGVNYSESNGGIY